MQVEASTVEKQVQVLATFQGGQVDSEDLARELEFQTKDERQFRAVAGFEAARNESDFIRRIALRRLAMERWRAQGEISLELRELARHEARKFWIGRWQQTCFGLPQQVPSEAELAAQLGEIAPLPIRLKLAHIFLRAEGEAAQAAAVARLRELRPTLHDAEQFHAMATQISESQSRTRGGRLGWIRPGWLAPAAEPTLFAMTVGQISEPLALRGGVHLFLLEGRREAEDPRPYRLAKLRREAEATSRKNCRAARLLEAKIPVRDKGQVLEIGSWTLPLTPTSLARERLIEDEILYQWAQDLAVLSPSEVARCRDLEENVFLARYVETRAEAKLGKASAAELRALYGEGSGWRRPRQLAGSQVRVPLPTQGDPLEFFDQLEEWAEQTRAGQRDIETLARQTGGRLESWPLQDQLDVASLLGATLFDQVKDQELGRWTGPFQDGDELVLVLLSAEERSRPFSYDEVLPDLEKAWRLRRLAELKAAEVEELLRQGSFRVIEAAR